MKELSEQDFPVGKTFSIDAKHFKVCNVPGRGAKCQACAFDKTIHANCGHSPLCNPETREDGLNVRFERFIPAEEKQTIKIYNGLHSWILDTGREKHGFISSSFAEELKRVYESLGYVVQYNGDAPEDEV